MMFSQNEAQQNCSPHSRFISEASRPQHIHRSINHLYSQPKGQEQFASHAENFTSICTVSPAQPSPAVLMGNPIQTFNPPGGALSKSPAPIQHINPHTGASIIPVIYGGNKILPINLSKVRILKVLKIQIDPQHMDSIARLSRPSYQSHAAVDLHIMTEQGDQASYTMKLHPVASWGPPVLYGQNQPSSLDRTQPPPAIQELSLEPSNVFGKARMQPPQQLLQADWVLDPAAGGEPWQMLPRYIYIPNEILPQETYDQQEADVPPPQCRLWKYLHIVPPHSPKKLPYLRSFTAQNPGASGGEPFALPDPGHKLPYSNPAPQQHHSLNQAAISLMAGHKPQCLPKSCRAPQRSLHSIEEYEPRGPNHPIYQGQTESAVQYKNPQEHPIPTYRYPLNLDKVSKAMNAAEEHGQPHNLLPTSLTARQHHGQFLPLTPTTQNLSDLVRGGSTRSGLQASVRSKPPIKSYTKALRVPPKLRSVPEQAQNNSDPISLFQNLIIGSSKHKDGMYLLF